ncbi:MAG: response regulator receiver protein [Pedosphaera sp.]|nr:response regulator receiver protein [Pedosphaera sp.]
MNRTVLLVEDLENDIILMRRSWKLEGVKSQLQAVSDGRQALDYLAGEGEFLDRDKHPLPCLVLLDLKLPYVMGLEVLKWIRAQNGLESLPVLVLTTSALQRDIDEAYKLGANAFLVKPSGVAQLAELVRLIRDFWLGANCFPQIESELIDPGTVRLASE